MGRELGLGALDLRFTGDQLATLERASALELGFPHDFLAKPITRGVMFGGVVRQVLAGRPDDEKLLLVVDQLEELFTHCHALDERRAFIASLVTAARAAGGRCRVVLGVRADFYPHCTGHADLIEAWQDGQVTVGPLTTAQVRAVISKPAAAAGLVVETALIAEVVAEAAGEPAVLPLLSHALLETWRRRKGTTLTLAGYQAAGGIRAAATRTAEQVYDALSADRQHLARQLFLRLVALGEGTEDTKRRVPLAELGQDEDTAAVVEAFTRARLLTLGEGSVEVSHEVLVRSWPRLRAWLDEGREAVRRHRRLTESASEWDRHGRDPGFLYRGSLLAAWEGHPRTGLNELERAFLSASGEQRRREQAAGRRRRGLALAGLSVALVVVSVLAVLAVVQADRAVRQRDLAAHRQLVTAARAELDRDPETGLLLATRAFDQSPSAEATAVLRQAVVDSRVRATLPGAAGAVAIGRRLVATGGTDGGLRIWRREGSQVAGDPRVLSGVGAVTGLDLAPDGTSLAVAGMDGTVSVWNTGTGSREQAWRAADGPVSEVRFGPDSRRVAAAGEDGVIRIWRRDQPGSGPVLLRAPERALSVAFDSAGRRLAAGGADGAIRLWDLADPAEPRSILRGHDFHVPSVAFSPDGRRLASAGKDGTVRVWYLADDSPPAVLHGHSGSVEAVAFSPDGQYLATGGNDNTLRLWNAKTLLEARVLRGHGGVVVKVSFGPEGTTLASLGLGEGARLWDVGSGMSVLPKKHRGPAWGAATAPAGTPIASGGHDSTVRLWRPEHSAEPVVLDGHEGDVHGVAVAPDGRRVASIGADGIRLWDPATGREIGRFPAGPRSVGVAFSPDGNLLAAGGPDDTVRITPLDGRPPRVLEGHQGSVRRVAFSPDGRRLASASEDGTIRIWDTGTGKQLHLLHGKVGALWDVAFSPDGTRLAGGGDAGSVLVWDQNSMRSDARPRRLVGHRGAVWDLAFSPDGRWIASASGDQSVRFWPVTGDGTPIVFDGFGTTVETVAYGSDPRRVVSAHEDGTVRTWTCTACAPAGEVRALAAGMASRELTAEELDAYLDR
ncbi:WD40 repeat domain-containing protein [Amycolatopsis cihanbeyliensis]|uniref:WD-40 repeat-containing protein n=1 Tax=Amycolatopsis cihanbeyliensis TaxID=1128664 RepID=A0A542DFV5_AMYCI|nr:hypothetical protein [Amycolatopsis cihanbeyliensis]TQJ01965.1 WD-40 repeat-containing protein [Amycolatopsis cihanbeyliensis]